MASPGPIRIPIVLEVDGIGLDERLTALEANMVQVLGSLHAVLEALTKLEVSSYVTPETGPR